MFDSLYCPQLRATADRLELSATTVRGRAALLAAAVATCPWDGAAASVFAVRADETLAGLRRGAARLDEAAAALRRHAVRAEAALAQRRQQQLRSARELVERGHRLPDQLADLMREIGWLR